MHDCLYDDFFRVNTVQKGIRKPVHETTAYIEPNNRPSFRVHPNVLHG